MNINQFMWHAKRGHGECILVLKNNDKQLYKNIVKKIVLNNYAFKKNDEFRSSYAYQLASFYNNDLYYIELLYRKLIRTNLNDNYTFEYLINNLYFFLKNKKDNKIEKKISKLLVKKLTKDKYNLDENNSISALISLILDLKMEINMIEIVNKYYSKHENSNLDLSNIEYNYKINFIKKVRNTLIFNPKIFEDIDLLLEYISNEEIFNKNLPFITTYINKSQINYIFELLFNNSVENKTKTNILKIIYCCNAYNIKYLKKILSFLDFFNDEQKIFIYEMLCDIKSKKLLGVLNIKEIKDSLFIRVILKNYNANFYDDIHQKIIKLKINYSNSDGWFDVENALISYFKRKNFDVRLLNDLKYFLNNGLSSSSRYEIVKILKRFNMLTNEEIINLQYDANYDIRKLL